MRLRSEVGTTGQTQFIPLHNAGNIPLDVSIEVTEWPDLFVVMPMRLTIQPGDQSRVMIRFEPKENVSPSFERCVCRYMTFVHQCCHGYDSVYFSRGLFKLKVK